LFIQSKDFPSLPLMPSMTDHIQSEIRGNAGFLTLNRARALNALSLQMIRSLTATLLAWREDPAVRLVAIRGMHSEAASGEEQPFGAFCSGGDIRFFYQAALAGAPVLEDFFTEEYTLNYLLHRYPKPVVAFMDGIVMGGGMGIAQAASLRIATERCRMAMPETNIGLFPDVGGGYFLGRCPGHLGEYLALTGHVLVGAQTVGAGLADGVLASGRQHEVWSMLATLPCQDDPSAHAFIRQHLRADGGEPIAPPGTIDRFFGLPTVSAIVQALEAAPADDAWACDTAASLRQRSPLMLHVALEQVRRGRNLDIADDLRMERDLVRHTFHPAHLARSGTATDIAEGIRALAVDKDHRPRWNPARIEDVQPEMVEPFFRSPWPAHAHPLRALA
jgi:enoyl-CoA hydratase/carnithine racemase